MDSISTSTCIRVWFFLFGSSPIPPPQISLIEVLRPFQIIPSEEISRAFQPAPSCVINEGRGPILLLQPGEIKLEKKKKKKSSLLVTELLL